MFSNIIFVKKASFLKTVKPRGPLFSCSRMRVGESSPNEEENNKFRSIHSKTFEFLSRKSDTTNMQKYMKHLPNMESKSMQNPSKNQSYVAIGDWKSENADQKLENRDWRLENGDKKPEHGDWEPEN